MTSSTTMAAPPQNGFERWRGIAEERRVGTEESREAIRRPRGCLKSQSIDQMVEHDTEKSDHQTDHGGVDHGLAGEGVVI